MSTLATELVGITVQLGFHTMLTFMKGASAYSQRFGDLAGPSFISQESLSFSLIPVNSSTPENVTVPYLASFVGVAFTDQDS